LYYKLYIFDSFSYHKISLSYYKYIFLCIILYLTTTKKVVIFNAYKKWKYCLIKVKIIILILLITTTLVLILNIPFFIRNNPEFFIDKTNEFLIPTILFNISNAFYCSSVILFLLALFEDNEISIELEIPSKFNSKKGDIPVERFLKGYITKSKFFLSMKDLEKNMFICGATGTGKSNFLQNFLINFKKIFNIPFFLVEFKGEYQFLQKRIDDILILWPGQNFSINIFNPGKITPLIHAERIFDILKSGKFLDDNAEFSPQRHF